MNRLKKRWGVENNSQLVLIFVVFAITGTTASYLSKPVMTGLGIDTLSKWVYWPLRILLLFPIYQILLVFIGAVFGQFKFFWNFEKKMLNRMRLGRVVRFVDKLVDQRN